MLEFKWCIIFFCFSTQVQNGTFFNARNVSQSLLSEHIEETTKSDSWLQNRHAEQMYSKLIAASIWTHSSKFVAWSRTLVCIFYFMTFGAHSNSTFIGIYPKKSILSPKIDLGYQQFNDASRNAHACVFLFVFCMWDACLSWQACVCSEGSV